ncbi:MAG: hypothetical protein NZ561_06770 [Phycisphaerae bacterium]|nr:hypothetical protein [Phycisphaerae bacterium]
MLLQTNSYIVPKDKRTEHARLLQRFKQLLARHGCDHFEVYEQTGANWSPAESGRFVQILRFRDRQHWLAVQQEEKNDPQAKQLIAEFCELINLPYQMQAGMFSSVYFTGVITQQLPRPSGSGTSGAAKPAVGPAEPTATQVPPAAVSAAASSDSRSSDSPAEPAPTGLDAELLASDFEPRTTAGDSTNPDRNGDSDVLEFLADSLPPDEPATEDSEHQRID